MDGDMVLYISQETMKVSLMLSAPVLVVTLVVGLGVAMLQAVTSLRDNTLGLVLKLVAVAATVMIAGSWMLQEAVTFTAQVFNTMGTITQ